MKNQIFDLVIFDPAARERVVEFEEQDIFGACDFLDSHGVGYAIFRHDDMGFAGRENPFSAANLN
jgi:hypothetical protein